MSCWSLQNRKGSNEKTAQVNKGRRESSIDTKLLLRERGSVRFLLTKPSHACSLTKLQLHSAQMNDGCKVGSRMRRMRRRTRGIRHQRVLAEVETNALTAP